jgi:TatA/E family protein of Tat protein translocase
MGIENPVHLLFIAAVALLVLGPKRLPDLAKALGHGIREFRESMSAGEEDEETEPADPPETAQAPPPAPAESVAHPAPAATGQAAAPPSAPAESVAQPAPAATGRAAASPAAEHAE